MHPMSLAALAGLLAIAHAAPSNAIKPRAASECPEVTGTFSIENYRLYPENLDWDPVNCKLYIR